MCHSFKLISNVLLATAITFLTGCSNVVLNHNIAINDQSNDGYIAVSGNCAYSEGIWLYYKTENSSPNVDSSFPFTCHGMTSSKRLILKLPAGKYIFYNIVAGLFDKFTTNDFKPIEFEVFPGKVIYLGRFYISLGSDQDKNIEMNLKASDESQTDIPWFLENFKNIPQSAYTVKIMYLNANQDATYSTTETQTPIVILLPGI